MESNDDIGGQKKARVLIVSSEFPPGPGGIGTHAFELATNLVALGHRTQVICEQHYADSSLIREFNATLPFRVNSLDISSRRHITKVYLRVLCLIQVIQEYRPHVIIASGSNSLWSVGIAGQFWRTKFISVVHGGELTFISDLSRMLTRLALRRSDLVICVSRYTSSYLPRSLSARKVVVINNGANHHFFRVLEDRDSLRGRHNLTGKRLLLTVGSVTERKGQDTVIRALRICKTEFPNLVYMMAGRSDYLDHFKGIAQECGLSDSVFFLGSVTNLEILELYNLADIFILNSRVSAHGDFEGFGISVIEAALCGVPSIVSKNSGLEEAIVDGITGVGVQPNSAEATAAAIIDLLRDDEKRLGMGKAARDRALEKFTWERVSKNYSKVLESLR